jgi:hypothetical protein
MNLEARVSKLEAATDTRAPITIWADDKTPEQIEAEITERGGSIGRRVLLVGWKKASPEMEAVLPPSAVWIATGVPRALATIAKTGKEQ